MLVRRRRAACRRCLRRAGPDGGAYSRCGSLMYFMHQAGCEAGRQACATGEGAWGGTGVRPWRGGRLPSRLVFDMDKSRRQYSTAYLLGGFNQAQVTPNGPRQGPKRARKSRCTTRCTAPPQDRLLAEATMVITVQHVIGNLVTCKLSRRNPYVIDLTAWRLSEIQHHLALLVQLKER